MSETPLAYIVLALIIGGVVTGSSHVLTRGQPTPGVEMALVERR